MNVAYRCLFHFTKVCGRIQALQGFAISLDYSVWHGPGISRNANHNAETAQWVMGHLSLCADWTWWYFKNPTVSASEVIWHASSSSSSWWRTPSSALPYWRLDAKYPYLLPSSMLYGPQSSGVVHPHLLFSARWLVGDQQASSSLLVVLKQRRWHGGDLHQGPSEPGVQRTSGERTSPYRKLASTR